MENEKITIFKKGEKQKKSLALSLLLDNIDKTFSLLIAIGISILNIYVVFYYFGYKFAIIMFFYCLLFVAQIFWTKWFDEWLGAEPGVFLMETQGVVSKNFNKRMIRHFSFVFLFIPLIFGILFFVALNN